MERSLPTIITPLPWQDPEIGGYYSQATTVMKYSHCPVQERVLKYNDNHRPFQVLDFLSRTPWQINKQVLAIVEDVWTEGGEQSCIPKRYSEVLNSYTHSLKLESDHSRRKDLNKKIQAIRDEISLRGDFNLKLNIARAFSKLDYFYFPHNFDFRGRVYPIPPHFNHIGNDLVRGLLLFGQGKTIGPHGLRWLKIHTANLMGKDKAPIEDKLHFVEESLTKIHQMAEAPLQHREWLEYEDCWQAIASIIDLSTALKQPKPEEYVSCLHVHQDGSCNGLQHYAALGRDTEGAYQVNLSPQEKPSDIYTHVARMVSKMIEADLEGPPADHHLLARKLLGNIKRKTIKQTVMTSVYGVTFIGAREQIYRQLMNQNFMGEDENYAASIYLAKLTLMAISILFTGAHGIKEWFRQCAGRVSKTGNPVGWITPLGLPVVEPYRKLSRIDAIRTLSHNMHLAKEVEHVPSFLSRSRSTKSSRPRPSRRTTCTAWTPAT
jgi:DNA-directed RNA polymerase, mitochondrial